MPQSWFDAACTVHVVWYNTQTPHVFISVLFYDPGWLFVDFSVGFLWTDSNRKYIRKGLILSWLFEWLECKIQVQY